MKILSDVIDGYIPTHTSVNAPAYGPGTSLSFGASLAWVTFLWWRVRAWRLRMTFSGSKQYTGVNSNGNAWSYTESYGGGINQELNITTNALYSNGFYVRPEMAVTYSTITSRLFIPSPTPNGLTYSYAWDYPPPNGAPNLPTNTNGSTFISIDIFGAHSGSVNPALNVSGVIYPTVGVVISPMGGTAFSANNADILSVNVGFQDSGGTNIGVIPLYRNSADLPVNAVGNIRIETIWPQP